MELPPRARRILCFEAAGESFYGTTSACAENTPEEGAAAILYGNYLRVRGEYECTGCVSAKTWELPPRARRILWRFCNHAAGDGTTSACAENTSCSRPFFWFPWNYLRVRGEYAGWRRGQITRVELPPRARRIPLGDENTAFPPGTTSACAENTLIIDFIHHTIRNYLRVRGEYFSFFVSNQALRELPPRARRIRCFRHPGQTVPGTTSACAENTFPPVSCPTR